MKRIKLIPGTVFHINGYNVRCFMVAMMLLPTLPACSPKIVERIKTEYVYKDRVVRDSLYVRDSIHIKQYVKGDTVYVDKYVDRWHWRDREVHDTLVQVQTDSIPYPVPAELSKAQQRKIDAYDKHVWTIAALILALAAALVYIFRKPLVNLFRLWLK